MAGKLLRRWITVRLRLALWHLYRQVQTVPKRVKVCSGATLAPLSHAATSGLDYDLTTSKDEGVIQIQAAFRGYICQRNGAGMQTGLAPKMRHSSLLKTDAQDEDLGETEDVELRNRDVRDSKVTAHISEEMAATLIQDLWYNRQARNNARFAERKASRQEAAAYHIQLFYRKHRRSKKLTELRRTRAANVITQAYKHRRTRRINAATKLQGFFRARLWRQHQVAGALTLQRVWRGRQERRRFKSEQCATLKIQSQFRRKLAQRLASSLKQRRADLAGLPLCDECEQEVCTILCSGANEIDSCRAKYCDFCSACVHKLLPMHDLCNVAWDRQHVSASLRVQQWWRRIQQRLKKEEQLLNDSALEIQRCFRTHSEHRRFRHKREAAKRIQKSFRKATTRREYLHMRKSAVRIQAMFRQHQVQRKMDTQRGAAKVIQVEFRKFKSRRDGELKSSSAVVVQRLFRKRLRKKSITQKQVSAQIIQRSVRRYLKHNQTRRELLRKMHVKQQLKARSRIIAALRKHQERTHARVSSAVRIQAWFRCLTEWTRQVESISKATRLQTLFRSRQRRVEFVNRKEACVSIQRTFRRYKAQHEYREIRAAAVRVQTAWRRINGEYASMLLSVARTQVARDSTDCVWSRHVDPWSKQEYFCNRVTQETRWDCPEELLAHEAKLKRERKRSKATTITSEGLSVESDEVEVVESAEDWLIHFEDSSGAKYYENKVTGTVCWERPAILGPDPDVPLWTAHIHPINNFPYYTNTETGETCWERPKELGPEYKEYWDSEEKKSYWVHVVTEEILWKDPFAAAKTKMWYAAQDEEGNTYYYLYNPLTEKTEEIQWEKPEELLDDEERREIEIKKWEEYWSSEFGKSYFVNKITGETSWKKPF